LRWERLRESAKLERGALSETAALAFLVRSPGRIGATLTSRLPAQPPPNAVDVAVVSSASASDLDDRRLCERMFWHDAPVAARSTGVAVDVMG